MTPNHVAIIMDGNGRWAERRRRPRIFGHIHGAARVRPIVKECSRLGIKYLTLYAFSSENWGRPTNEVQTLMKLLCKYLVREEKNLIKENVRFNTIGNIEQMPSIVQKLLAQIKNKTSHNTGLCLTFALSYGSQQEILRAVKNIVTDISENKIATHNINEDLFKSYLYTHDMPDPDLIIRTSGEMRLSNFLLWQAAYSEIYVTPQLWPEFTETTLREAVNDYSKRHRRFGLIAESQ